MKRLFFSFAIAACAFSIYVWATYSVTGSPQERADLKLSFKQRDIPINPTSSGAYLASRAAQFRNEWGQAASFLDQALILAQHRKSEGRVLAERTGAVLSGPVLTGASDSEVLSDVAAPEVVEKEVLAEGASDEDLDGLMELKQRVLIFQLGAGDFDAALEQARDIYNVQNSATTANAVQYDHLGFAQSVLVVDAFRDHDYDRAEALLHKFSPGAVSDALQPLFDVWLAVATDADDVKQEIEAAELMPLHEVYAFEKAGLIDEAQKRIEYLNRRADNTAAKLATAIFYARNNQMEKAQDIVRDLIVEYPDDADLLDLHAALRNPEERLATDPTYETLSAHMTDIEHAMAVSLYDLAMNHMNNRSEETALLLGQLAYALTKDVDQVNFLLVEILQSRSNYKQALSILEHFRKTDSSYPQAAIAKAEIYDSQDRRDKAYKILTDALEETADPEIAYFLASLYRMDERYEEALEAYNNVAKYVGKENLPDRFWGVYYYRGVVYHELDQWDKAEEQLLKAKELRPDNPYVLNYLGYSWVDMDKNIEEGLRILKTALDLSPNSGFITDSVGWAYYKMGDYDKATEYLERAAALMPYDPEINDHLGDVYWQTGRKLEAYYQWNRAIEYAEKDNKHHRKIVERAESKMSSGL